MIKTITFSTLILTLTLGLASHVAFADTSMDSARQAAHYLINHRDAQGSIDGVSFSGWALQGIKAAELSSGPTLTYIENNLGTIENASATDVERTILAALAGGRDPHDFGGKNLVSILKAKVSGNQIGATNLVNDDIFGVLALLASGEPTDSVITDSVNFIASTQRSDGSFSWSTTGAGDSNNTAVTIEALQYAKTKGVSSSANLNSAIEYLHQSQNNDGGFGYQPGQISDADSTSWAVNALVSAGISPESWNKGGNNPMSYLQSLQQSDGGIKWQPDSEASVRTTAYAAIALAHKALPVAAMAAQAPSPSPVPSPIPSPSPSLSPTPTPVPSPNPSPTPSPSATPSAEPTQTPVAANSPTPSHSLNFDPTPPMPSPHQPPTPSPIPSLAPPSSPPVIASPSLSPSPVAPASASPSPLAIPSPSPLPSPSLATHEPSPQTSTPAATQLALTKSAFRVIPPSPAPSLNLKITPQAVQSSPQLTTKPTSTTAANQFQVTDPSSTSDFSLNEPQPVFVGDAQTSWKDYWLPISMVVLGSLLSLGGIIRAIVGYRQPSKL